MRLRIGVGVAVVLMAMAGIWVADENRRFSDFTAQGTLTLSDQTNAILDDLDVAIDVTVLLRRDDAGRVEAASLLERYERRTTKLSTRIIDPNDSPGEVARLGVDPVFGGVAAQRGNRVEVAPGATEADITAAIARLVRDEVVTLCFTTGFGETPIQSLSSSGIGLAVELLNADGFLITTVDLLANPSIPDECGVVILASPQSQLTVEAMAAVSRWTVDDGKTMVLADPASTADLGPLLATHALRLQRGIVFEGDPDSVIGGDFASPLVRIYRQRRR